MSPAAAAQAQPAVPPAPAGRGCPDLKATFGASYRVTFDPADTSGGRDKWMQQVPCKYGLIYPRGGDTLAVEIDGHPGIANRLLALGLRLAQEGDREKTFLFPLARFPEVADLVKPRRRRVLSEAERVRLVRATEGRRFARKTLPPGRGGAPAGRQAAPTP